MHESLLAPRIEDALNITDKTGAPHFVGFLTPEQCAQATLVAAGRRHLFSGGYEQSDRKIFAALPDWCDEDFATFPITPVTVTFRSSDKLSHRDFLGTLMSLGITRESVGDILIEAGRAVIFLNSDIYSYVSANLEKVGGVGVQLSEGFSEPLPGLGRLADFSDTVSSLRLDCVVCALAGISRAGAVQFIELKKVSVNGTVSEKTTKTVGEGDKITLRGVGKFIIGDVSGLSKKGRVILHYKKYI